MLAIAFKNFKDFVKDNNKRIYFFQNEEILEMYFITEGVIVKSFINVFEIENREAFFSDRIFQGSTKLLFNITNNKDTISVKDLTDTPQINIVEKFRPVEDEEDLDIQKEGVE